MTINPYDLAHKSGTLYVGTKAVTAASAVVLAATQAVSELIVQAKNANTANVLIGNSTDQVIELAAGQSITLPVTDLALVYLDAASGTQNVVYLARS